ncbi:hypothetical protein ACSBR2_036211 [Camellia fascicularis]
MPLKACGRSGRFGQLCLHLHTIVGVFLASIEIQSMEKRGWIPVLNQRGSKGGWRKEANARLFTIFVDDLPRSMNLKMMGEIFRKFGVVKDIYIPLKRRRVRNIRFAFVQYDCEVAAEVAVQKANGI